MIKPFFLTFVFIAVTVAPGVWAQTSTNSDFDPFPQMEQDMNNTDSGDVTTPQQQNDGWPPANNDTQANNGDPNE